MTDTLLSDWLTLSAAAKKIGVSQRTVIRLARAGKLEQRLRPETRGHALAVYNPVDVTRIAAERRPAPPAFVLPAVQDPPNGNGHGYRSEQVESVGNQVGSHALALTAGDDPIRQLFAAALRAVLSPPSLPLSATVSEKLFLTIPEAAIASGLSRTYLRRLIADGTLPARKDRGWRIRRRDLEQL